MGRRAGILLLCFLGTTATVAAGERFAAVPSDVRAAISEAGAGRKCAALKRPDDWIETHPDDVGARVLRGDVLMDCLHGAPAIADYRAALGMRPDDAYASRQLLEALLFSGRYRRAETLLARQATRTPGVPSVARILEQVRQRADLEESLAARRRFLAWLVAPGFAAWLMACGWIYRRIGRLGRPRRDA